MAAQIFGPYVLLEKLVTTAMAEVFLAVAQREPGEAKLYAVKRMHPNLADVPDFRKMFHHEAAITRGLRHANLEHVVEDGEIDGRLYIVTEYLHGRSLERLLQERHETPIPPALAVYVARELARALEGLHAGRDEAGAPLRIIKRDLSPNDVFLTSDGRVKMLGLGVAKSAVQLEQTQPGTIKGKFSYMSPEQARMEPLDQRSDLYSLGLVLREMLSGRPAFLGATDMETFQLNARAELPRLHALPDALHAKIDWVLDNALAVARDLRYADAAALATELDELLASMGPADPAAGLARVLDEVLGRELADEKNRAAYYLANN